MVKNNKKIDSLTGLRFLAALMIILDHSNGAFFSIPILSYFALNHGVSLFFILSGFILTYVYPELRKEDVLTFIRARIARIWPAHMAALILVCIVLYQYVQFRASVKYFIIAASMTGSWIPIEKYFSTYNIVSWSIATEFFFYLCFPLLIYRLAKTWHWKLMLTAALTISIILICNAVHLPMTGNPDDTDLVSWIYVNPLSRLFEFMLGMCVALLYHKISKKMLFSFITASIFEILSFALLLWSLRYNMGYVLWYQNLNGHPLSTAQDLWFAWAGGSCLAIAVFILSISFQKGIISRILSLPLFVLLGEISYSLYLVHYTYLSYYGAHRDWFNSRMNIFEIYGLYWLIILGSAFMIWLLIEMPCRRFLTTFSFSLLWNRLNLYGGKLLLRSRE